MLRRIPPFVWPLLLAAIAFAPVVTNRFVNWDDEFDFVENYHFRTLSPALWRWAFRTPLTGEYRPLAWIQYALEYRIWGLAPWGYHLTSLLWHLAVVLMAYLVTDRVLRVMAPTVEPEKLQQRRVAIAFAVGLWAIHPLRVEAVAWAAAQGLLPCTFFYLVAVACYLRGNEEPNRRRWLGFSFVAFFVACLFRTLAVTLPLLLLILDAYPLRRLDTTPRRVRAILEKLPFFAVALLFSAAAVWAKQATGAMNFKTGTHDPVAYLTGPAYSAFFPLLKTVIPYHLCAFYRVPSDWASVELLLSVIAVGLISLESLRRPAWLASWAAYLVLFAPNLGFIRHGSYLTANRYSYLPMLALVPLASLALLRLRERWEQRPRRALAGASLVTLALGLLSYGQLRQWHDSLSLWQTALDYGNGGTIHVCNNLGLAYLEIKRLDDAEKHLRSCLVINEMDHHAYNGLGRVYMAREKLDEAVKFFEGALLHDPERPSYRFDLAYALIAKGEIDEAKVLLEDGLSAEPYDPAAHRALADLLNRGGEKEAARAHFDAARRLEPDGDRTPANR